MKLQMLSAFIFFKAEKAEDVVWLPCGVDSLMCMLKFIHELILVNYMCYKQSGIFFIPKMFLHNILNPHFVVLSPNAFEW